MTVYRQNQDNAVDRWVKAVSRGKSRIPLELETKLVHNYQTSSGKARQDILDELISYNAYSLAAIVLKVYHSTRAAKNIEPVDLLQEAVTVFTHKLGQFDTRRGARLITYYTRDVRTSIQRYIASNALDVRQGSVYLQSIATQISMLRREVEKSDSVKLSQDQIADKLGVSAKTVAMVEQFTSINVVEAKENMTASSDVAVGNLEDAPNILFEVLERKLARLSPDQFKDVCRYIAGGENIPPYLINLIKKELR